MKTLQALLSAPLGPSKSDPPFIYRIIPHTTRSLAAISSDDSLRAFTPDSLNAVTEAVHEGVTCLEPGPGNGDTRGNILLTAGRNGDVKLWDGKDRNGRVIVEDSNISKTPITSLASAYDGHLFATGMEQVHSVASVAVWDLRRASEPVVHYKECHQDDVTKLVFSKNAPNTLLSGSTDGLVNIYDITTKDEDNALLQVANHGASIHHAGFISNTAGSGSADALVFALSHDETFSLYVRIDSSSDDEDMGESAQNTKDEGTVVFGDLRPKLDCEYVTDVFSEGGSLIMAAGSHSAQRLDLIPLSSSSEWGFQIDNAVRLMGAHGEEIVRTVHIDEQSNVIYTGGEDGLVKVWRSGEPVSSEEPASEMKDAGSLKQKKKKDKRYRPY